MEFKTVIETLDLEKNLTLDKLPIQGAKLRRASEEAQTLGSPEWAQKLGWEGLILYLFVPYTGAHRIQGKKSQLASSEKVMRFAPFGQLKDGPPFPDVEALLKNQAALIYYRERAIETPNVVLKARYADFIWESNSPDKYKFAIIAAESYLSNVEIAIQQGEYRDMVDALKRSLDLGLKTNNITVCQAVKEGIFQSLNHIPDKARARWVLDLGRIMLYLRQSKFENQVNNNLLEFLLSIVKESALIWKEEQQFHLEQECFELAADIAKFIHGKDSAIEWEIRVAESIELEAEAKIKQEGVSASFAAVHFYDKALNYYQQIISMGPKPEIKKSLQSRVTRLNSLRRKYLRSTEETMTPDTINIEFSLADLQELITPLFEMEAEQSLRLIAAAPWLLPDMKLIEKAAEESFEQAIFWRLAPTMMIRRGTKVNQFDPDEKLSEMTTILMSQFIALQTTVLDHIFGQFKDRLLWTSESLQNYLRGWELMNPEDMELLEIGIENYFAEDYVSAVHIITPRIENVIKGMFEQAGEVVLKADSGNSKTSLEQGLGEFLRQDFVKNVFGNNMWYYIENILVNPSGLNLRNDVAHGWITKSKCNRHTTQLLIYTLLLLTLFHLQPTEEGNSSQ